MERKCFLSKKIIIYFILFEIFAILGVRMNAVFSFAAFLVSIIEMVTCQEEENFYYSIFLIPHIRILDATGILFLVILLIVLPLAKYFVIHKSVRKDVCLYGGIMFFTELTHQLILGEYSNIPALICWIGAFVYCFSILFSNYGISIKNERIYSSLSIGVIFSAGAYIINNLDYARNIINEVFDGSRFKAYADDPNFYSLYICLAIAILFTLEVKTITHYISFAFLIVIGLLTASKMCFLLMAFIIVYALFSEGAKHSKKGTFTRRVVAILIGASFVCRDYFVQFINNLLKRAGIIGSTVRSLSSVTTGRSVIIMNYIYILIANPIVLLVGAGFSYHLALSEATGHGAHNTYMDIILSWGIIGFVLIMIMLIHFRTAFRRKYKLKKGVIYKLPVAVLLINFLDLSCFSATMFWWIIVISVNSGVELIGNNNCFSRPIQLINI